MARRKIQTYGVGALVAAGAVALVVGFVAGRATAPKGGSTPAKVDPADGSAGGAGSATYQEAKAALDPSPSKGPADAAIVLYEISEFQ